jgi:hypothetical protein
MMGWDIFQLWHLRALWTGIENIIFNKYYSIQLNVMRKSQNEKSLKKLFKKNLTFVVETISANWSADSSGISNSMNDFNVIQSRK